MYYVQVHGRTPVCCVFGVIDIITDPSTPKNNSRPILLAKRRPEEGQGPQWRAHTSNLGHAPGARRQTAPGSRDRQSCIPGPMFNLRANFKRAKANSDQRVESQPNASPNSSRWSMSAGNPGRKLKPTSAPAMRPRFRISGLIRFATAVPPTKRPFLKEHAGPRNTGIQKC